MENNRKIIVSTTFREFTGTMNDRMQLAFLRSLRQQTYQNFMLVVTLFGERRVEDCVKKLLGEKCCFIKDPMDGNYQFSLSKTFRNGVDYGLAQHAQILLDCSSDVILQKNFLETVAKRCSASGAGISHPNIFRTTDSKGEKSFLIGKREMGIDARFFSLEMFKNPHVYGLLEKYPSYDYGAGIENFLCGIGIKYGRKNVNIFMESKVLKMENDRNLEGKMTAFMRQGAARNYPTVRRFLKTEGLGEEMFSLEKVNRQYRVCGSKWRYFALTRWAERKTPPIG